MASTYSNLKIQLMATGENSTTWGNVTNTNLGTAIEEAIVGSADVTFASNNQSLSLSDTNASQPARNMRLRLTGTTGGSTRNLVVPSIEKPYIVQNDCADSVLVKTTAGTGITVPAGKTMWVYSDGFNVVDVVTHVTSLTLGSPLPTAQGGTGSNATTYCNLEANVSGILPVANGGTGSNATTFCNAQINVAGILPIANGGTGSNATTFCNVEANITGVTPVENGGTGLNTLTNNAIVIGNAASAVKFVAPGTSGNVLTSNGTSWLSQAPVAGGAVTSVTGTANQVISSPTTGAVVLSLPQSINTTSNVRFASFGVNTNASGTAGEIRATNNITAYYSSDARLKENVKDIQGALDAVAAIGGKTFDWTDAYITEHGGEDGYFVRKQDFGVIAQDVERVFSRAVRKRDDGTLAVDYEKLVALAFQAIKELRAEVEALKNDA